MSDIATLENLMTLERAAKFLGFSKDWLYKHKEVPHHRIGSKRRYDPVELRQWLKKKREEQLAVVPPTQMVYHRSPEYRS